MSALYPRGNLHKLALCLRSQVRGVFSYSLLLFPFGQGPPNLPSFSWAGYTKDHSFSELALDAKLAFSILHKVQGTRTACLGEELVFPMGCLWLFRARPWAKGGQRSVNGLTNFPSLNSA